MNRALETHWTVSSISAYESQKEKRERGRMSEEIMAKILPNLMKNFNLHIEES